ncbi:MAG: HAD-IA family hydrolase [archaeon]
MAAVKGIVFDLDGVYFLKGKENFISNLGKVYGVSETDARRVFLKSREMNNLYKAGKMNGDEFWAFACKEWKIKATKEELVSLLISGYEVNREAEKISQTLRTAGYKLLVCTNNFKERLDGLEKRFGISKIFGTIVSSHQIGALKPGREIFSKLAERAKLAPGEIFLADDHKENVEAAKAFGINAVLYEDFAGFVQNLKKAGVKVDLF